MNEVNLPGGDDAPNGAEPLLSDYLSDTELAAELAVSKRTIERWRRFGKGPPRTKIGKKNLTRRGSVRAWLRSHEEAVEA